MIVLADRIIWRSGNSDVVARGDIYKFTNHDDYCELYARSGEQFRARDTARIMPEAALFAVFNDQQANAT